VNSSSSNQALHPTPEAGTFLANAILEQNFSFAKSSLASGAGELYEPRSKMQSYVNPLPRRLY